MSSPIDAAAVIARMKSAARVSRDEDLARELGLSRSAIANWRHRNSIPIEPLAAFAAARNVSLDSLVTGMSAWGGLIYTGVPVDEVGRIVGPIDEALLGVALEKAAGGWAAENPGGDLKVSELARDACRFYDYFSLALRANPDERKDVIEAVATAFRPYSVWRRVKSSELAKVETRQKVETNCI